MRGYLLGLLTTAVILAGTYELGLWRPTQDPCRACGAGTRCEAAMCLPAARSEPPVVVKKRPRRGAAAGAAGSTAGTAGEEPARPAIVLKPGDLKSVSSGDNLGTTEVIDLTREGGSDRELEQEDLDAVFRKGQPEVLACLDEARGEAPVTGRMTVSLRVQRSGAVSGVRIEAPAYLMAHGLATCVRPIIVRMRFPASSRGQVVSYPFSLN